jgi:hypothetical protein
MDDERVDGDVDDEPGAADEAEADELHPVGRLAHPMDEAHVGTPLGGLLELACVEVDSGGLLRHL